MQEDMPRPISVRFGAQHMLPGVLCTATVLVGILLAAPGHQAHQSHQALHFLDITQQ